MDREGARVPAAPVDPPMLLCRVLVGSFRNEPSALLLTVLVSVVFVSGRCRS